MAFETDGALGNDFSGVVRLFPLPNMVILPGVIQGLHIFEPRYCEMTKDALANDQLITMATVDPAAGAVDLELSPPLSEHVCIGKIISHNRFEDGRYNLLLLGSARGRILEEIASEKPYRTAHVEIVSEKCQATAQQVEQARHELIELYRKKSKMLGNLDEEMVANLANPDLPFGMFVDLICFSLSPGTEFLHKLLANDDAWQRHLLLRGVLDRDDGLVTPFPPKFSDN